LPFAQVNNTRLYYRLDGAAGAPVLILSHSIGTDHGMWGPQMADLLQHFQVLRYDSRGHGASDAPAGEYTIEQLGRDVLGLADALNIEKFAFCGLSMGGAVGQWLAINSADHLTGLVLANTSPQFGSPDYWDTRRKTVLEKGMAAIRDLAMQRFFSSDASGLRFLESAASSVLLGTNAVGYAGCCSVLRNVDTRSQLGRIKTRTLVIAGNKDVSTPWEGHSEILAREIPGAKAIRLPAAHLSNQECPRAFTVALLEFLLPVATADPLEAGFNVRRATLGDAYVERSIAGTTDFSHDFQELITRYAWGTIWTRPGLDRRTRRLLVLAMMLALGRWEEFSLHVRAGLLQELELCDLKEVLLQAAVYAGVPVANSGFHLATEEIEKARQREH
jgi:3-oxoadipate enol-lactonase / 4-carboxymuconolactone decarboxylase